MDKMNMYRELVKRLMSHYVEIDNRRLPPGIEHLLIMDEARDHYIWLNLGWSERKRLNTATMYVRLKDGKIWIEEDWTDFGLANDLVREGVPKEDIVLAFHAPEMRPYTEFAAA